MMEFTSVYDESCDWCARQWGDPLRWFPLGNGINFLCQLCWERESQRETALDGIDVAAKEAAREVAA